MKYSLKDNGDSLVAVCDGVLNFACNAEFLSLLKDVKETGHKTVVLQLGGVPTIDSVGLGLLFIAHEDLGKKGRKLVVSGVTEKVRSLLTLTQADQVFEVRA